MIENGFKEGTLKYRSLWGDFNSIKDEIGNLEDWDDGYLAFSSSEVRKKDMNTPIEKLSEKVDGIIEGASGYLMEIDLWRKKDSTLEEIYIERNEKGFFMEKWMLFQKKEDHIEGFRCYYREIDALINERSILKRDDISTVEVVVPEVRLHIFITVKRG